MATAGAATVSNGKDTIFQFAFADNEQSGE
jgi:hypothetical protein